MKYYDEAKNQLKDNRIIDALRRAADDFDNGAILETRDTLVEIVNAIDQFERWYD